MIEINDLSRRYGTLKAVDGLTLRIEDGLIYGFLGVNGAGKSTTLGMMTGCLAPSGGSVKIDGFDIQKEPIKAKQRIGYLPEIPPLYTEMTPEEYLIFVARAKNVEKSKISGEVDGVMRKTGIYDVRRRLIKQLSKGYRQRVGLAQALIGSPAVIILDEPTVGLDPEQMVEIRELIRSLKGRHTVVFSSHILSEVSLLCDRVFIIDHGKLICEDTPENLSNMLQSAEEIEITLISGAQKACEALGKLENVENVEKIREDGDYTVLLVRGKAGASIRDRAAVALSACGAIVAQMSTRTKSLEDVFISLTRSSEKEGKDQ